MVEIIQSYGIVPVIIIAIVLIGAIAGVITWFLNTYVHINRLKDTHDKKILDEDHYNNRMDKLEENDKRQDEQLSEHGEMLKLLVRSDKNRIKQHITDCHVKYMALGYIDLHTLSIIHEEFEVYEAEDGNSWVKGMVEDLDTLPIKE